MNFKDQHMTIHPALCDYIAHLISKHIKAHDVNGLIDTVGKVRFDVAEDGSLRSTTKRVSVVDIHGKTYTVTVEEVSNGHTL